MGLALLADKDSEDARGGDKPHTHFLGLAFSLLDPDATGVCARGELEEVIHMLWPALSAQRLHEISAEPLRGGAIEGGEAVGEGQQQQQQQQITREQFFAWGAQPAVLAALKSAFAEFSPLAHVAVAVGKGGEGH